MSRKFQPPVVLCRQEREALEAFVSSADKNAREINRARILLLSDTGKNIQEIADLLHTSRPTVSTMRKKYHETDYEHILSILKDAPRSGRPIQIDARVEANITLIACSPPPEGAARWSLHMIADKVVELNVVDSLSHESVRSVLKKTN